MFLSRLPFLLFLIIYQITITNARTSNLIIKMMITIHMMKRKSIIQVKLIILKKAMKNIDANVNLKNQMDMKILIIYHQIQCIKQNR